MASVTSAAVPRGGAGTDQHRRGMPWPCRMVDFRHALRASRSRFFWSRGRLRGSLLHRSKNCPHRGGRLKCLDG
eukprot:s3624_g9.t1